jgi:hypothetical protein
MRSAASKIRCAANSRATKGKEKGPAGCRAFFFGVDLGITTSTKMVDGMSADINGRDKVLFLGQHTRRRHSY